MSNAIRLTFKIAVIYLARAKELENTDFKRLAIGDIMRRIPLFLVFGSILVMIAALACGSAPTETAPAAAAPQAPAAAAPAPAPAPQAPQAPQQPAAPAAPAPAAAAAPAAAPQAFSPAPPTGRTIATPVRREAMEAAPATGPKSGGIIRWTPQASVANLDPTRQTSFVTHSIVHQWYDYPFGWNLDRVAQEQMVGHLVGERRSHRVHLLAA